jgi:hypothetical protein
MTWFAAKMGSGMENAFSQITCDGCGLPASAAHIAERVGRLERATRFRPVHISVLFLALTPLANTEDDFYGPPQSKVFFDSFMDAVGISATAEKLELGTDRAAATCLTEFQRKGYYLAYLSECAIPDEGDGIPAIISRLGPTPIRRIQLNYRPKKIALLGKNMAPLIEILEKAGVGPALVLDRGEPFAVPETGDFAAQARFRAVLSGATTSETLVSEYDSIQVKHA